MSSPNLDLATVPSNSLQPSVPVNDANQVLDALVQLSVEDKDLTTPPTTVSGDVGKRWIVGPGATGAWSGKDDQIALCTAATVWRFLVPKEGFRADVRDENSAYRYSGGSSGWTIDALSVTARFVQVMMSDMTTDIAAGTAKAVWFAPEDGELVDVWIGLHDPSSAGDVRIDMNDSGGSVFTTRPLIQATEATSLTGTAAVLDGTIAFVKGDKFTFDIDDDGTDAKGLMATVEYSPA